MALTPTLQPDTSFLLAFEDLTQELADLNVAPTFETLAAAQAADLSGTASVDIRGRTTPGVGGGIYRKVVTEPTHGAKFTSADGSFFTLAAKDSWTPEHFGAVGDGVADDTGALQALFDAIAAREIRSGRGVSGARYKITSPLIIEGWADSFVDFNGAILIREETGSGAGEFIRIGSTATPVPVRVRLSNFDAFASIADASDGYVVDIRAGVDITVETVRCTGIAGFLRLGENQRVSRVRISEISGNFGDIHNHRVVRGKEFTGTEIVDFRLFGDEQGRTDARTVPTFDFTIEGLCDVLQLNNVEAWSRLGSPQGMLIDGTNGEFVNMNSYNAVFDKSGAAVSAAIFYRMQPGATGRIRNHNWNMRRSDTGGNNPGGNALRIQQDSSSGSVIENLNFNEFTWNYRDRAAVVCTAAGTDTISGINFSNGSVQEAAGSTIQAAFDMGISNWSITGCSHSFVELNRQSDTSFFVRTIADVNNFVVANNNIVNSPNVIQHFAYANPLDESRIVANNTRGPDFLKRIQTAILDAQGSTEGPELTISGAGSVAPTHSHHIVDTAADAATDDLDDFDMTSLPDGFVIQVSPAVDGRAVVVRHGVGKIRTSTGASFQMDHAADYWRGEWNARLGLIREVGRYDDV